MVFMLKNEFSNCIKKKKIFFFNKSALLFKQLIYVNKKELAFFNLKLVFALKYCKNIVKRIKLLNLPFSLYTIRGFWNLYLFYLFKESFFLLPLFTKLKKKKFFFFYKRFVSVAPICNKTINIKKNYTRNFAKLKWDKRLNIFYLLKKKKIFFFTLKYIKLYSFSQKYVLYLNKKFLRNSSTINFSTFFCFCTVVKKKLPLYAIKLINNTLQWKTDLYLNLFVKLKKQQNLNNSLFCFDVFFFKKSGCFFNIVWYNRFPILNFTTFFVLSRFFKANMLFRLFFLLNKSNKRNLYIKNKQLLLLLKKKNNHTMFLNKRRNVITIAGNYIPVSKFLLRVLRSYSGCLSVFSSFKFYSKLKKKVQILKAKIKFLKRITRICTKSFYSYLFFYFKKLFKFKKFVQWGFAYIMFRKQLAFSLNNNKDSASSNKKVFINSLNLLNSINFNKNYLLFNNKLRNLKKFNLFFSTTAFGCKKFKIIKNISRFKQIFIYLRYLVVFNKSNFVLKQSIKSYRKKRSYFLKTYLRFFQCKRFFFFNLALAFFWKKRTYAFVNASILRKYRFFFFYKQKNSLCTKENNIFNFCLLFKGILDGLLNLKSVSYLFMYKQVSFFFFKYKYYLFIKTNNMFTTYFIYNNNYLAWNFLYFWYWYLIAFLLKKNIFSSSHKNLFQIQHDTNNFNFTNSFILNFNSFFNVNCLNTNKSPKMYLNVFFQSLFKYILAKNANSYKKIVNNQIFTWKKQFVIFKKFYIKFSNKLKKRTLFSKLKARKKKKLKLRLKSNKSYLNIRKLNIFSTCGYYNYFKRKFFRKRRIYKFFLYYFKKTYQMQNKRVSASIINKIGIINVVTHFNNTYVTLTDILGNVLFVRSGGLVGIKGPNRSTTVTSEEVTLAVCSFLKKTALKFLILKFSGVLYSRKLKAAFKVFTYKRGYKILRVFNNTAKAHNGIRLKKKRRL